MGAVAAAVVEVHRVVAVQVGVFGRTVRIARPQRAGVILGGQAERTGVLSQAVDVGRVRQLGTEAQILRLEDQRMAGGVEEDFAV